MTKLKDRRYTYNAEWCGYNTKKYVVRFCGQWLDKFDIAREAVQFIHNHKQFIK
jgi:hypothetical protein